MNSFFRFKILITVAFTFVIALEIFLAVPLLSNFNGFPFFVISSATDIDKMSPAAVILIGITLNQFWLSSAVVHSYRSGNRGSIVESRDRSVSKTGSRSSRNRASISMSAEIDKSVDKQQLDTIPNPQLQMAEVILSVESSATSSIAVPVPTVETAVCSNSPSTMPQSRLSLVPSTLDPAALVVISPRASQFFAALKQKTGRRGSVDDKRQM